MRHTSFKYGIPAGNPIANVFVIIAGTLIIGVSIVLGFFAFLALAAIVLVTAAVVGIRLWWHGRKLQQGGDGKGNSPRGPDGGVIEGEFKVIESRRDEP